MKVAKIFCLLFAASLVLVLLPRNTKAATPFASHVSGRILLDVENRGEAWYVHPLTQTRHYLGRPQDAFNIMSYLSLGISDADLAKIPTETETFAGDTALRARLKGRILLQVQDRGKAWYISPSDQKRYFLGNPRDAFALMTRFGMGITMANLAKITAAEDLTSTVSVDNSYRDYTLNTGRGLFPIKLVTLRRDAYSLVTDTSSLFDCELDNCFTQSLADFAAENKAAIAIHGTYFCPPDYTTCLGKTNSFLSPVYNTTADVMINEVKLPFHAGPMLVQTSNGQLNYFHRTANFGSTLASFEANTGLRVNAAIANDPALVENGSLVVDSEPMTQEQKMKGTRSGIGYNNTYIFLVVAPNATVTDLAYIFQKLGATYALNLDGGGSAALYYNGEYKYGPGRALPNAILFKKR